MVTIHCRPSIDLGSSCSEGNEQCAVRLVLVSLRAGRTTSSLRTDFGCRGTALGDAPKLWR